MFSFFYFLLIKLPISTSDIDPLIVIGDKNLIHRSHIITQSFSNLSINGPFYCRVTWIDDKQSIDIYTDRNIHPYVLINIEEDTLEIMMQSDTDFEVTDMDIHLNLHSTIKEIFLAGISSLQSTNVLKTNNLLTIRTEGMKINESLIFKFSNIVLDTSSINLEIDVPNLDAILLSAGTTELMGHVKDKAIIKYNGVGNVDASQLYCKHVDIEADGLGTVWITGTDECNIKAEGVSVVRYYCPNITHIQSTGLAEVISI
jgi:hypothetical protein